MLENHMVFNTPDAPWNAKEPPELETETCVSCGKQFVGINGEWFTDYCMDHDGAEEWVEGEGKPLEYAGDTPAGFCCSRKCRAEAMYAYGDDFDKDSLRAYVNALFTLQNDCFSALQLVKKFLPELEWPAKVLKDHDHVKTMSDLAEQVLLESEIGDTDWANKQEESQ